MPIGSCRILWAKRLRTGRLSLVDHHDTRARTRGRRAAGPCARRQATCMAACHIASSILVAANARVYLALIERRCRREPSAYIVGQNTGLICICTSIAMCLFLGRKLNRLPLTRLTLCNSVQLNRAAHGNDRGRRLREAGRSPSPWRGRVPGSRVLADGHQLGARFETAQSNAARLDAQQISFVVGTLLIWPVSGTVDLLVANLTLRAVDAIFAALEPETSLRAAGCARRRSGWARSHFRAAS